MRLDQYLVSHTLAESRNKASALIVSGGVTVNSKRVIKPSYSVSENDVISIIADEKVYVARSAKKLLTAVDSFGLSFKNKIAVDLGASTGGFCEVMLENDVKRIYAVDIGTNQLHPKIKNDDRIINMEHTNARYITRLSFDEDIDVITCDLSFISLKLIMNAAYCTLKDGGEFICLIKPQFEAGPSNVGKNGVVKDKNVHFNVVKDIAKYASEIGFCCADLSFSGLEGESGNREFLLYLVKSKAKSLVDEEYIKKIVLGE